MSLIQCAECKKDVSDKALSCPNCGNPLNNANSSFLQEAPAVTVQRTFKKWKTVKLLSWLLVIIGLLCFGGGEAMQGLGFILIFFGFLGLMVAKFGAWWTTG